MTPKQVRRDLTSGVGTAGGARLWALLALTLAAGALLFGLGLDLGRSSAAEPENPGDGERPAAVDTAPRKPGTPNRLAKESSPYLLLHQNNPVDWYPWGEEALERARREEKPIFLSVGYSTCYWCHVMEREVFSNPEIAALMNRSFVCIKVDREERPDIDQIYITATQLITGGGGWPNSVFLTPDLEPFFAGTYFPPEDRDGLRGFPTILTTLADRWQSHRQELVAYAHRVAAATREVLEEHAAPADAPPAPRVADRALDGLRSTFDHQHGGFGPAPKFPTPANLFLLLDYAAGDREARKMLATTLDAIARGGIYDQLGGGFHRYSTDARWRVPHFEKMLYDNGLLMEVYARWYALSEDPQAARVLVETAAFLGREMTSSDGALWSAIDAETDGEEGAFYVWRREEIEAVVGGEEAAFLAPILGFEGPPSFEDDRYVLYLPERLAEVAAERQLTPASLAARLDPLRQRLLAARGRRQRPLTDDKVLADWNGAAIAGLAAAGQALDDPALVERAGRAARFVLDRMRPDGGPLRHAWRQGAARIPAYLADYAFLVHGLLALHAATGEAAWLGQAARLTEEQIGRLRDPEGGYFAAAEDPHLLFRSKDPFDGALPSPNGIAVLNLLELAERTGERRWHDEAAAALRSFGPAIEKSPHGFRTLALAARRYAAFHAKPASDEAAAPPPPAAAASLDAAADDVVTARAELGEPGAGRWQPLTLHLEIAPGWHLNANPASNDFLIPTKIEKGAGDLRRIHYPPGKLQHFAFADEALSVYDGSVAITAELRPPKGAPELLLTYQACDDRRCLPPVQRQVAVP